MLMIFVPGQIVCDDEDIDENEEGTGDECDSLNRQAFFHRLALCSTLDWFVSRRATAGYSRRREGHVPRSVLWHPAVPTADDGLPPAWLLLLCLLDTVV